MRSHRVPESFHPRGVFFTLDPSAYHASRIAAAIGGGRYAHNWALGLVKDQLDAHRAMVALALRQGARRAEAEEWAEDFLAPDPWGYAHRHFTLVELAIRQGASVKEARKWADQVAQGSPWSAYGLRRAWNRAKDEVAPWWEENSKESYSSAMAGLAAGLTNWRSSRNGTRKGAPVGFPRFQAKGAGSESVTFTTGSFGIVDAHHVRIPKLDQARSGSRNLVKVREDLTWAVEAAGRGDLHLYSLTITKEPTGRLRGSFQADERDKDCDREEANPKRAARGYDAGLTTRLMPSAGKPLVLPKPTGMARAQRFANEGLVVKRLGISPRSPVGRMVTEAIGTTRTREGKLVRSVSKEALDLFLAATGDKPGVSPYARAFQALADEDLLESCRRREAELRAAAVSRRHRRRARRGSRLTTYRSESIEDRITRLDHETDRHREQRQSRRATRVTEAQKLGRSAYDRGWALPDPNKLARAERGRRRHDRQLSRQRAAQEALGRKERSNRYRSTRRARAKACADQRNARKDFAHKATIREARRTRLGVVETLGVKNLMAKGGRRKRGLNRGLGEAGLRMILSFLSYKLVWNGGALLVAPRFYPSTKRCSRCGQVKDEMALSERIYRCARCHAVMDRDRNAGKNLEQLAPILALLTMLVSLGVVDPRAYDKMIGSWTWDRKASGSVGPTTETAWLAERSQPRATGVVLRDEPRSSPARSDTGQHNEHRFQRTGNPLEAVV